MYVLQYELNSNRKKPVSTIGADVVASMNTHDMPTFVGYWEGLDVEDRMDLGLLSQKAARREKKQRESIKEALVEYLDGRGLMEAGPVTAEGALRACLSHLLRSPARVVLVNLEDLWLETKPQNVPGTFRERPNWRRKAAYSLEAFWELPQVGETFKELNRLRRQG
jgi:4-alpha-glucanotransferase